MSDGNPLAGVLEWTIRRARTDDLGYIIEHWSREAYVTHKDARLSTFRMDLKAYVQRRIEAGDAASVACDKDTDVKLYGFLVFSLSGNVRFVFVGRQFRRCGIARDLLKMSGLSLPIHTSARLTPHALSVKVTHEDAILYRPFTEES